MSVFVGRAAELERLRRELALVRSSGQGRFVWLQGRRRVGKSRLVQEFCNRSEVGYCFYQAPRRGRTDAVAEFAEALREPTRPSAGELDGVQFSGWVPALRAAAQNAGRREPVIIVIDELPYLVEKDSSFDADLQKAWDRHLQDAAVLLVCVGSDERMMETLVKERAPLHGRPTLELRVSPLDPAAVAGITGAEDPAEALDRYVIVGGLPLLAASWPTGASMPGFLEAALADDQTPFATTALRILGSEFRQNLSADRVIRAIGHGETAHGRVASRSGVKGNTLTDALATLVGTKRLVSRELPYAVPRGKNPARYLVADPYLRFWLRFVGPHFDELSRGRPDLVQSRIERDFAGYRGKAIEPVVRDALERLLADSELSARLGARHVGSWWKRDHSVEVDLVGGDAPEPTSIGFIGSIKWRETELFLPDDATALADARAAVPGAAAAKLVAVSRRGCHAAAEIDMSFGPEQLLAAW